MRGRYRSVLKGILLVGLPGWGADCPYGIGYLVLHLQWTGGEGHCDTEQAGVCGTDWD